MEILTNFIECSHLWIVDTSRLNGGIDMFFELYLEVYSIVYYGSIRKYWTEICKVKIPQIRLSQVICTTTTVANVLNRGCYSYVVTNVQSEHDADHIKLSIWTNGLNNMSTEDKTELSCIMCLKMWDIVPTMVSQTHIVINLN